MAKTTATMHQGNALEVLRTLPSASVQTCITSPPYYGLRDYGTAKWEGGDVKCDHLRGGETWVNGCSRAAGSKQIEKVECSKCGAIRVDDQIGLEETPAEYIARLVEIFEEVRRILKKDGTLWLNLGDSYAGSWGAQSRGNKTGELKATLEGSSMLTARQINASPKGTKIGSLKNTPGLKPKDLIGIPWRVAFALQAAGWWLRSDIIWSKPNPMPESVKDRPTRCHEYIFLLSKSERYQYDAAAIQEPTVTFDDSKRDRNSSRLNNTPGRKPMGGLVRNDYEMRNKRSVWTVATQNFKEAHFATFPEKLVEPCIFAGAREKDVVLDPFAGSGTVGRVALRHRRSFIGVELNPEYIEIARRRLKNISVKLFDN